MFRVYILAFVFNLVSCNTSSREENIRYSFWIEGYTAVKEINEERVNFKVPKHQIGELILDHNSDKFVYKYWNDYDREVLDKTNKPRKLKVISGFNGEFYWVAFFNQFETKDSQLKAESLYKYFKQPKPSEQHTEITEAGKTSGGLITNRGILSRKIHPFYNYAPIHEFLNRIQAASLKKENFIKMLRSSKFVVFKENKYSYSPKVKTGQDGLPSHWKDREGGEWIYSLSLDEFQYPLKFAKVTHAASIWSGPWPYMMESSYEIVRGSFNGLNETGFSPEKYIDSATKIKNFYLE